MRYGVDMVGAGLFQELECYFFKVISCHAVTVTTKSPGRTRGGTRVSEGLGAERGYFIVGGSEYMAWRMAFTQSARYGLYPTCQSPQSAGYFGNRASLNQ